MTTSSLIKERTSARSVVRLSKPEDISAIRSWLEAEDALDVHGNFLCNWGLIERAHRERRLLVYIDGKSGLPIGFQLGRLLESGILQVKQEFRHRGIGRRMVEYCIRLARRKGESLLSIQCKPSTSIPFWERMGFTLVAGSDPPNKAIRVLEYAHPLPVAGVLLRVVVRFYPEDKKWDESTPPYQETAVLAKPLSSGVIQLDSRVSLYGGVLSSHFLSSG